MARWAENRLTAKDTEVAGRALCERANLEYSEDTAEFLAGAISRGEHYLLSRTTVAQLHQSNPQTLRLLADEVIG